MTGGSQLPEKKTTPLSNGERRLDDPNDYVRLEIETALALGILVIPILDAGNPMPQVSQLPASMQKLVSSNAFEMRSRRFDDDIRQLLNDWRAPFRGIKTGSFQRIRPKSTPSTIAVTMRRAHQHIRRFLRRHPGDSIGP